MDPFLVKKDMRVLINKIDVTHKRHGSNPHMKHIIGKVDVICYISETDKAEHGIGLRIRGTDGGMYIWAPEDVSAVVIPIFKPEKFDPKNLII